MSQDLKHISQGLKYTSQGLKCTSQDLGRKLSGAKKTFSSQFCHFSNDLFKKSYGQPLSYYIYA